MKISRMKWIMPLLVVLLLSTAVQATPLLPYINDNADLLNTDAALEQRIMKMRDELKIDIVIVTTYNAEGKSSQDYADDFYDYNDFGYDKPRGDGVLFLIDMDNREAYISTCGKAIYYFTDARIDLALDEIVAKLQKTDYEGACDVFLDMTEEFMTHSADEQLSYGYRLKQHLKEHWFMLMVMSAVASVVIVLIMVHNDQNKKVSAGIYLMKQNGFRLTGRQDQFINETTTSRKIPRNEGSSGGGGGGGSSTHTSSSGTSHGGGGRSF